MALPKDKQSLADWILRRLGAPIVNVEITDDQLEDVIDEALQVYYEWHYEGTQRSYRSIKITSEMIEGNNRKHQDIVASVYDQTLDSDYRIGARVRYVADNKIYIKTDSDDNAFPIGWKNEEEVLSQAVLNTDYSKEGQIGIPVPENIYGISKVFRVNSMQSMGMWSYEYQMFLNNFDWFYGSGGTAPGALTNYYTTKMNIDFIDFLLNTQPAIRFNRHKNRLYIDTGWMRHDHKSTKDHYLLAEVYEITDPEIYGDVYSDKWLKRYATALAKAQWGSNLKKYSGTQLPGGITINGQDLYDEGFQEQKDLMDEMKSASSALFDSIIIG